MTQFIINEALLSLLKRMNIFQYRTGLSKQPDASNIPYQNRLKIGDQFFFDTSSIVEEYSTIAAGNNFFSCGAFSSIASPLPPNSIVGRYCSLAINIKTMGFRHPIDAVSMSSAVFNFNRENVHSYFSKFPSIKKASVKTPQPQKRPIVIGNDVWIGSDVTISGGVTIGNGAVIASNSLVTKNIEPYSISGGVPARHIKWRFEPAIAKELENLKWWDYELFDLYMAKLDFSSPNKFIENFNSASNLKKADYRKFSPYLFTHFGVTEPFSQNYIFNSQSKILFYDIKGGIIRSSDFSKINSVEYFQPLIYDDKLNAVKIGSSYLKAFSGLKVLFTEDLGLVELSIIKISDKISIKGSNSDLFCSVNNEEFEMRPFLEKDEGFLFTTGFIENARSKII